MFRDTPPRKGLDAWISIPGDPLSDLAFEAQMLDRAQPAIFWYSWPSPVLVLGYGQPVSDIDLDYCRARSIPVLRRRTGGTGVVHHRDLSLSLVLPADHPWAGGIMALYDRFLEALDRGLAEAGARLERRKDPKPGARDRSPICFEDQLADTLLRNGKKVVGCAQLRRKRAVLIHAAISLHLDVENYVSIFGVSAERIRRGLDEAVSGRKALELAGPLCRKMASALGSDPLIRTDYSVDEAQLSRMREMAPFVP